MGTVSALVRDGVFCEEASNRYSESVKPADSASTKNLQEKKPVVPLADLSTRGEKDVQSSERKAANG